MYMHVFGHMKWKICTATSSAIRCCWQLNIGSKTLWTVWKYKRKYSQILSGNAKLRCFVPCVVTTSIIFTSSYGSASCSRLFTRIRIIGPIREEYEWVHISPDCQVIQGFTLLYQDLDFQATKADGGPSTDLKMLPQKAKGDVIDAILCDVGDCSSQDKAVSFILDCKFKDLHFKLW